MLTFYLVIKLVLSVLLILTVKMLWKKIKKIEAVVYYLTIASIMQISNNIVALNLELITFKEAGIVIPILQLDRLIILPIITLWLIYFYRSTTRLLSFYLTIIWASLFIATTYANNFAGVLSIEKWNAFIGFTEMFVIYVLFIGFNNFFKVIEERV
ncbi:hypothetical protein [Aquibacillus salsiterrae]|uniref:Uncharacterized protein n=1 Tax=Aquibacillus salsiterrae TaxID=2950439 RepID=A0A9X4AEL8_9BACI|nr:hypothetical protein [Aquibacillus salsiterrae]MDC3415300.1 hypothetical protein [Aquibacillus salsiterrae]